MRVEGHLVLGKVVKLFQMARLCPVVCSFTSATTSRLGDKEADWRGQLFGRSLQSLWRPERGPFPVRTVPVKKVNIHQLFGGA